MTPYYSRDGIYHLEHPKTDTGIIRFWHPWAWATCSRVGIKYV